MGDTPAATPPTAVDRVTESAARRAAEQLRQPDVWAMAERLSRGCHSAPRTAAAIYAELISAYNLGLHHGGGRVLTHGAR